MKLTADFKGFTRVVYEVPENEYLNTLLASLNNSSMLVGQETMASLINRYGGHTVSTEENGHRLLRAQFEDNAKYGDA